MSSNLEIKKHFNAKVSDVYDAWTKPEIFSKWMGPGNVKCEKFESDLVVGGKYEIHMQTEDGIKIAYGEYKEILVNEKLSVTWAWKDGDFKDSLVTLLFKASENGTEFELFHSNLPSSESAEHHTFGWNSSFEKLEKIL